MYAIGLVTAKMADTKNPTWLVWDFSVGFLLEELVHFLVQNDLLLEDVSTRLRRLNHLDALRVRTSGVTGLQCCDRFLCHSSKPF